MQTGEPLRVAVVNDYELVIAGLAAMLEPHRDRVEVADAVLVGEPVDGPLDVVLYDTFGRIDEAPRAIAELLGDDDVNRVAVYTSSPRPSEVDAAMAAGAAGVLSKARPASSVIDALERIDRGEVVIDDGGGTQQTPWPGANLGLTARQAEVVALLLQGMTNAEIAEKLVLDINTVKTHLRHIYKTLGARSRAQVLARLLTGPEFSRR